MIAYYNKLEILGHQIILGFYSGFSKILSEITYFIINL